MGFDAREFVAEELWLLIGVVTVVLVSLAGIVGLEALSGAIAVVGFLLLVPLFLFWGEEIADLVFEEPAETTSITAEQEDDAIEELKRRYAAGEIDDDEFERRLDRLVGVEGVLEDAFTSDSPSGDVPSPARSSDAESREREPEWER
ncbi:hypothetical protein CV102_12625 [Natronococcus pandeyae]|uniref:SHOCT domain-containing protein n=1 Tax=Natronococcus pandeyae TaxID=2055836 RepID=A0A8J8TS02_9EURY|nr:SHOCT domain-containing protein [Natronococcus pandeyae]TYL38047.1 hypothetical protein CV102_12625 [Natronococcus pandeyae]